MFVALGTIPRSPTFNPIVPIVLSLKIDPVYRFAKAQNNPCTQPLAKSVQSYI